MQQTHSVKGESQEKIYNLSRPIGTCMYIHLVHVGTQVQKH